MKASLLLSLVVLASLITVTGTAQTKVAQFSIGKPGTKEYENIAFWIQDKKRTTIDYDYGENHKTIKLKYLGRDVLKGDSCFKVQFPNSYLLYIIPRKNQLSVTNSNGQYLKTFTWEYEGPVNGIGTFCSVCATDEADAIQLIHRYYMK